MNLPKMLEIVPQTSKAILFEKFDDGESLDNILSLYVEGDIIDSKAFDKIEKNLEVSSFKEFTEKFDPKVFQIMKMNGSKPQFEYSLKFVPGAVPVSICKSTFYELVQQIVDNSSAAEPDKNFSEKKRKLMERIFSPEVQREKAQEIRKRVEYSYKTALERLEEHRDEEAERFFDKCDGYIDETIKRYEGNIVSVLPLAIADISTVLETKLQPVLQENSDIMIEDKNPETPLLCDFMWNDEGQLVSVEKDSAEAFELAQEDNEANQNLLQTWESAANEIDIIKESNYMREVFISSYAKKQNNQLVNLPVEQLATKLDEFIDIYKESQQNFLNVVGELVQKVINVEMFFRHATTDTNPNLPDNAKLIIANCTIENLINNESTKRSFITYLDGACRTPKNKIWFAIIPPIDDDDESEQKTRQSRFGGIRPNRTASSKKNKCLTFTPYSKAKQMISILAQYKVMSFFNFRACKDNVFQTFGKNFNKYMEMVKNMPVDYSVFAYPNFTQISEDERNFRINTEISGQGIETISENYLKVPSVYIDAAYVAAGIIVSTQNAAIMKEKKFRIIDSNPFVRFNIESSEETIVKFSTIFNREEQINRSSKLEQEIARHKSGLCFGNVGSQSKTIIKLARTCGEKTKPIYQVLTRDFIELYFEGAIMKKTSSNVLNYVACFMDNLKDQSEEYLEKIPSVVNRLLCCDKEEKIWFDTATNEIHFKFVEEEETIQIACSD